MKRRNQKDHIIARDNKPEVTISVYDNGKRRSKWIGGIAVEVHGGESYSYDGFRTRALQYQTFEALIDRISTIIADGAPVKDATKPNIFDHFNSVFSEFFKNGGINPTKRDPGPHPESSEAARSRLNTFLAENYPSECTNGNLSATRFAEWPSDVAIKVIRALRHVDENTRHELKKLADFLSERYASHAKDGERTVDFAMRMLTPGNGSDVRRLTESLEKRESLSAEYAVKDADAREIGAIRNFMKGDIAEGEHPAAAAIRRMNSLSAKIAQIGAEVDRLTEANRRPVQWIRSVDGFQNDCPVGFVSDGDWQIISSDSGVVTWCRPMRATKVHHKPIVVIRSPGGANNGRRGRACFVGDKLIAMWLDVGNGAERVQPDGIEWGEA